ncbi:MAG: winged helix-turn-helix domain-containing protein [Dehalobacter sp. 4CP]|nr:winged helix-turn-helix domain-containing protein [Dehalobacter sp. 4CP]
MEDIDPGDLAARLILTHMPARVRDALREKNPLPSEGCGAVPAIGKKRRLSENPDALEQIRQMWREGEHNQAEIARRIGYHRATVNDSIKKMREAGELEE